MAPLQGFAPGCGYMTPGEHKAAKRLVHAILSRCASIQIFDGEDDVLPLPSGDAKTIISRLGSVEEDTLIAYDADHKRVGIFTLIYGNADDGTELVSDHTANRTCFDIYAEAFPD